VWDIQAPFVIYTNVWKSIEDENTVDRNIFRYQFFLPEYKSKTFLKELRDKSVHIDEFFINWV
jgi:hypothetical protein